MTKFRFRRYQREGIRAIDAKGRKKWQRGRVLLADDMGLGKTTQALGWAVKRRAFPMVVVCPASVKWGWEKQAREFFGLSVYVCESRTPPKRLPPADVYAINFEILPYWVRALRRTGHVLTVVDEVQKIKNRATKRYKAVRRLQRRRPYLLGLSGTPAEIRPAELFAILNLLRPDVWDSWWDYAHRYCKPRRTPWGWQYKGAENLDRLHRNLERYVMIRRRKEDVLKDLPKKSRNVIPIHLPTKAMAEYKTAERDFLKWMKARGGKASKSAKAVALQRIGHLKRLAAKLKLSFVDEWVETFMEDTDRKLVLFSWHRSVSKHFADLYEGRVATVNGSVTGRKRRDAVDRFVASKKVRLFNGNIQAAGVGLDGLQRGASVLVFVELAWTPAEHSQCEARVERIGQEYPVEVYYFVTVGTVEEDVSNLLQSRQGVLDRMFDGRSDLSQLDVYDKLLDSIKHRHERKTDGKRRR